MALDFLKVDYYNDKHMQDLFSLLQMYAKDPMGGDEAIDEKIMHLLPDALRARTFMHSFLVYRQGQAVGFSNCIESFSTFNAAGVLNIHDFGIEPNSRGQGVSQFLMQGIENFARTIACTKMSLEVLEGNIAAVRAYEKFGFSAYQLNAEMGNAMFWHKRL